MLTTPTRMNKKITSLLLGVLALGALSLKAQTPASSYSITADFTYTTKYIFRGVLLAKGAFQPSVKLTDGSFYASVWNSSPVDKGYEEEFDYNAGYGFKLNDTWSLDFGLTAYTYPGLDVGDKSTWEPYIGANGTFGNATSATYLYHDFTLKATTVQESLGYAVEVSKGTSVNFSVYLGYVNPDSGSGDYTYYGAGATVPFKISDKATFTLGVQWADHTLDGVEGNHVWGTADFNYAF
jgi:uncharacterized protein (TIGR02001 family)